jgi:hypothetical protein
MASPSFMPSVAQHLVEPVGPEDAHQVVFEAEEEGGPPRVALPARAAAQLVVDAAAFVAFGGEHVKTARVLHLLFVVGMFGLDRARIAWWSPSGSAAMASMILNSTLPPSLMSVPRPAMFVAMVIAPSLPASATICASCSCWRAFRTLWVSPAWAEAGSISTCRSTWCRPAPVARVHGAPPDGLDDGVVFLPAGAIDLIILVDPRDGPVGRDLDHAEPVDRHEFLGLGDGGAGHAGKLVVEAEVVLERDAGHGDVLGLDLAAFLGLDGLMQTVRQAAARHHPAGEFVDQHDLAAAHDVLLVLVNSLWARSAFVTWCTMVVLSGS